jgi:hypothetical protein
MGKKTVPGDLAQTNHHADLRQRSDLGCEMRSAVADLLGSRLIARGRAANHRSNPGMAQPKAVVAGDGLWFTGKP